MRMLKLDQMIIKSYSIVTNLPFDIRTANISEKAWKPGSIYISL